MTGRWKKNPHPQKTSEAVCSLNLFQWLFHIEPSNTPRPSLATLSSLLPSATSSHTSNKPQSGTITTRFFLLHDYSAISLRRTYQQPCAHLATNYSHHHEAYHPLLFIDDFVPYWYDCRRVSSRKRQRWTGHAILAGSSNICAITRHHAPF